jgi:hypothetical protein
MLVASLRLLKKSSAADNSNIMKSYDYNLSIKGLKPFIGTAPFFQSNSGGVNFAL